MFTLHVNPPAAKHDWERSKITSRNLLVMGLIYCNDNLIQLDETYFLSGFYDTYTALKLIAQNVKCWREWVNMWITSWGWYISLTWILALMANCSDISLKLIGIQLTTLADKGVETFQAESTMAWEGVKTHYLSEGSEQWIIWSGLQTMWCVLVVLIIDTYTD